MLCSEAKHLREYLHFDAANTWWDKAVATLRNGPAGQKTCKQSLSSYTEKEELFIIN